MLGDMTSVLGGISEQFTLVRKQGSLVKGQWVEGNDKKYILEGAILDITEGTYTYYAGVKQDFKAKMLVVPTVNNVKSIGGTDYEEILIVNDDKVTLQGESWIVTGANPISSGTNLTELIIERDIKP